MIPKIKIDEYIPATVLRDIRETIRGFHEKKIAVRVIRLGAEDFADIMDRIFETVIMPFTPTIAGVPVEPWGKNEVGVFAVADDDTKITADCAGKTIEE